MRTLKVIVNVNKGVQSVLVEYDNKIYGIKNADKEIGDSAYILMRLLTGTTNEASCGSLREDDTEYYGSHDKYFISPSYSNKTPAGVSELIINHISKVKAWVDECKKMDAMQSGEVTVTIADNPNEIIEKLVVESRLYYRNNKGQIKRLD